MIYSDLYILLLLIYKQEFILLQGIMLTDMRLLVLNYPKYIGFCYLCLAISPYRHHQSKAFWTIFIKCTYKLFRMLRLMNKKDSGLFGGPESETITQLVPPKQYLLTTAFLVICHNICLNLMMLAAIDTIVIEILFRN